MRIARTRATAVAALVAAATTLATVPAAAVPTAGSGTLTVTVLDDHGKPSSGILYLVRSNGAGTQINQVTGYQGEIEAGSYGVMSFTMWGGIRCVALDPCDVGEVQKGAVVPDGSLTVTAGETTTVRIKAPPPAKIAGTARVGRTLHLVWSKPMAALLALLGQTGATPVVRWMRDGEAVRGATRDDHVVVAADAGTRLTVRITYPARLANALEQTVGPFVHSRTTPGVRVRR